MNSQDQRWQLGVNAEGSPSGGRCCEAGSRYFCRRGNMSAPYPYQQTAVFLRQNDCQVFFQGHSGSSEVKRGPFTVRWSGTEIFPPPPRSVCRHQSVRQSRRDMFKTTSSPPTSRKSRSNSAHAGRRSERDSPAKVDHICEIRNTISLNGHPECLLW